MAVASEGVCLVTKISLSELRTRAPPVDRAKLDATTEAQIEAYRSEDGYGDLPVPDVARVVESSQALRVRLGLTQKEIAAALRIPLGTRRNWEQGRVTLEPAAALLVVVSRMPEAAMDALGGQSDRSTGTS
ncbi:transcriptional regulator [Methylobacterium sp. WL12]|uniref:helix-turn-helix domain-containing protein n=1 Tax=Methylobacterium sp. WL12 TaxID=2603890 RepID=UPI001AEEF629|nr:transcriptional regulator [Methylobacterium sp. WL12]